MNSIQKYVLNSLFERDQITEEKLAQALDTFSNEPAIDSFLSVLITGQKEIEEFEEYSPEWNLRYYKQFKVRWSFSNYTRIGIIGIIKEVFKTDLKTAKEIVDISTKEEVIIPKEVSKPYCILKHNVEEIVRNLEDRGLQVEVTTALN